MRPLMFFAGLGVVLLMVASRSPDLRAAEQAPPAPRFTQTAPDKWLNSAPLTWEQLRGNVVLLEFWTYTCFNCYRSIPWLNTLTPKFAGGDFRLVSVHTPEFEREKVRANIEAALREHQVKFPVMMDNDYGYWNALDNRYWPAKLMRTRP